MPKSYDSEEVFVAVVFETNSRESKTIYAGHDEKLALGAIKNTEPGEYDHAEIQRWKDGERKYIKEYSLVRQVKVVEL